MKRPNPLREECLASLFLRHLWREVLHLRVLPRSGLTHSDLLRDPGDWLFVPVHLSYILNLVHADHFLLPLSVDTEVATERGILGMVGVPMRKPEKSS